MTTEAQKKAAANAACDLLQNAPIIGVGTGSTVQYFIEALQERKIPLTGAIPSSRATETQLKMAGIEILDLNMVDSVPYYIDGADQCNVHGQLIKGGGGALTREKILATFSEQFICIVDQSKHVETLTGPVPIEVINMARSPIAHLLLKLKGRPVLRSGYTTDNGNPILDIHDWQIKNPLELEYELNQIPGVVCHGIFARQTPHMILTGTPKGVISTQP